MQEIKDCLTYFEVKHFCSLPGEHLLIAKKQHWIVLLAPLFFIVFAGIFFLGVTTGLFIFKLLTLPLFIATALAIINVALAFALHEIIDWYFHVYILSDRKLLEILFQPIFSHVINDVFLDQVRTTEIDIKVQGFLYELLDIGDIIVVFDRPSHEETFIFKNIKDPRATGTYIADALETIMHDAPIWYHPRSIADNIRLNETVFPKRSLKRI